MRTFKVLFVLALSLGLVSCTNNASVNHAFMKYGHGKGIVSITVPGFVLRLAASIGDLEPDEKELLRSIDKVKVLAVKDQKRYDGVDFNREFYWGMNRDGRYQELLNVTDNNERVTVFGRMENEDVINEMVVLIGGENNALIYLKGRLEARMLDKYVHFSDLHSIFSFNSNINH